MAVRISFFLLQFIFIVENDCITRSLSPRIDSLHPAPAPQAFAALLPGLRVYGNFDGLFL